ncbi:diphthine--ammonia ligase [Methanococcus maripaludis]|uniref:Uncharacterized protein (TIGR00290 family) n=2 Tax=Methanococcus maripaludis TaxID=39152 RepID=A0A7J9PIP0_METMI|nr:diphthine--ammonia ligase [Methanococcus maripaludis]MBA2862991.1 uncharacterized protein (TIGR00290 family) [Methanococcus maripaludis]
MEKIAFSSWSGGKDGCLALYRAENMGLQIPYLFTMIEECGERSRSHGLRKSLLKAQADAMGKTWEYKKATWDEYETEFLSYLHQKQGSGITHGIFGDIDLENHRKWVEGVCGTENIEALLPIWQEPRKDLIKEFLDAGFVARIIAIDTKRVPKRYLGMTFSETLIEEFETLGIDACGENGEFHTVVLDGPNFMYPLDIEFGKVFTVDSYLKLDIKIKKP